MEKADKFSSVEGHRDINEYNELSSAELQKVCPFLGNLSTLEVDLLREVNEFGSKFIEPKEEDSKPEADLKLDEDPAEYSWNIQEDKDKSTESLIEEQKLASPEPELKLQLDNVIEVDKEIAEVFDQEPQKEAILDSLKAPEEDQLQEVVRYYDDLREMVEANIGDDSTVSKTELSIDRDNVISAGSLELELEPHEIKLQEVVDQELSIALSDNHAAEPEVVESSSYTATSVDSKSTEMINVEAEYKDEDREIEEVLFPLGLKEVANSSQDDYEEELVNNSEKLDSSPLELIDFESEFSPEEITEIDEILDFSTIRPEEPGVVEEVKLAENMEESAESSQEYFTSVISNYIDSLAKEGDKEELQAQTRTIKDLGRTIVILEADDGSHTEEIELLKSELLQQSEILLGLLEKDTEEKVVKRFVEKIILAELQELVDDSYVVDEGTHENKPTLSKLLSDFKNGSKDKKELLLSIIGRYALA